MLEWATAQCLPKAPVIVDLCTGSGALALALLQHWPAARVIGIDDSDAALEYARSNSVGTEVELVRADATDPGLLAELDGQVDLVVANPPYVPDDAAVEPEVSQYDPPHAVFGGPDGMTVINAIVRLAGRWLCPGGFFAVEHDDTTSSLTSELISGTGLFDEILARTDLNGRPRFVTARRRGRLVTDVFDCADPEQRSRGITSAAGAVKNGRLVVLPTDTVYGIGADAFDSSAVAALLSAKGRGRDMPVPVLVGSWHTIDGLALMVSQAMRDLIRAFWPGALSLVVRQAPSLQWDLGDARGTVMLRMPLHPVAIELLREVGPMAVSSANVSGSPPAVDADDARRQLGDLVDVYLDAGPSAQQAASTILDLTGPEPRILRPGPVSAENIAAVLGLDAASLTG